MAQPLFGAAGLRALRRRTVFGQSLSCASPIPDAGICAGANRGAAAEEIRSTRQSGKLGEHFVRDVLVLGSRLPPEL